MFGISETIDEFTDDAYPLQEKAVVVDNIYRYSFDEYKSKYPNIFSTISKEEFYKNQEKILR
ncbi:hypothetical protein [Staphylococcus felis]|uniref:Uncharacterized protein n=1 Tax=Staphylococcus felis TaxID=46127 RepID=A0ABS0QLJ4_9STAP|nr:hypothetical protein [Staphylococcus felis]MBH9580090.1 hypothetical protein [Staphylococcus felis]REI09502.1 hypothetical protein DOS69_01825 [Staphylococcus felis]REI33622.1 hypothetical protein DOS82_05860 [Staphylococcus felis]